MSEQSTVPTIARIEFVCPCHQWNPNRCDQLPIAIEFYTKNFEVGGEEAMRSHRASFVQGLTKLYDEKADELRQKLNEMDPGTERPPIARHGMMLVDAALTEQPTAVEQEEVNV